MVWDSKSEQDERLRFIGEWLRDDYCFSWFCERYGVSRKTGYKWVNRYQDEGIAGLECRSHARLANMAGVLALQKNQLGLGAVILLFAGVPVASSLFASCKD